MAKQDLSPCKQYIPPHERWDEEGPCSSCNGRGFKNYIPGPGERKGRAGRPMIINCPICNPQEKKKKP